MAIEPFIPENITVHLGTPNSSAENVTVPFPDYIKNVASSEIYPTWPESAIRANIYAQISFALNRIYTEWYRSRGYDFDITSTTAYDQSFGNNRAVFENVSQIVDEIFNSYVRRQGTIEPLFTSYCSGRGTNCEGLKQWGTVGLAEQGLVPYEILQYYYGDDIDIVSDAPVRVFSSSYPGLALRQGDSGNDVQLIQSKLNRIARNYPNIPTITPVDGVFGKETDTAVKKFQQIFNLTPDGIVGNATWYKIAYIYTSVKRLAELDSEGISINELPQSYERLLQRGDSGDQVRVIQYYLALIAQYYDSVPPIQVTGYFGEETENAVKAFQRIFGLTEDGIVGAETWADMYRAYRGIIQNIEADENAVLPYPGEVLRLGSTGDYVYVLQNYLVKISESFSEIPRVTPDGVFGQETDAAVRAFQTRFGITANGVVGPVTWDAIATLYDDLRDN